MPPTLLILFGALVVIGFFVAGWATAGYWKAPTITTSTTQDAQLESRIKSIETEWLMVYDKLNRLAGRLTKERGLLMEARTPEQAEPIPSKIQTRSALLVKGNGR